MLARADRDRAGAAPGWGRPAAQATQRPRRRLALTPPGRPQEQLARSTVPIPALVALGVVRKTTTSTNLAVALAQAGRRVLLVDGDLRRPRVAPIMGLEGRIGLTTVLVGRTRLEESIQVHEESGVHFLACGPTPPNPSEILQARATHDLLRRLRDSYDAVIIDAPPLLLVADAAILATAADGAIIVTRHGKTSRDHLQAATQRLDNVGARLFGTVVNMIPRRFAANYYCYYYEEEAPRGARWAAGRD